MFEETGIKHDYLDPIPLGSIIQKGGKEVFAWGCLYKSKEDPEIISNTFALEWPPGSGIIRNFPEVDLGRFFSYEEAIKKIKPTQIPLLERLIEKITLK